MVGLHHKSTGCILWLFLLFCSKVPAQSFLELIAPQYHWESAFHVHFRSHPYDSLNYQRASEVKWANGMLWRKPYEKLARKNFFLAPILQHINYNTVQGLESSIITYYKPNKTVTISGKLNYGLSDKVIRPYGSVWKELNPNHSLFLGMGNALVQFNNTPAIVPRANTVNTILYQKNYAKYYDLYTVNLGHIYRINTQSAHIQIKNTLALNRNNPVKNSSAYYIYNNTNNIFSSNNPLFPLDYEAPAFRSHKEWLHTLHIQWSGAPIKKDGFSYFQSILLGIKMAYPFQIDTATPTTNSNIEGLALNTLDTENYKAHARLILQHKQIVNSKTIGTFSSFFQIGGFLKKGNLPFTAFMHFNGNQTAVMRGAYLEVFGLLPYYERSTDKTFGQLHLEHNFKGLLLQKIPFVKELNWHSIFSVKRLLVQGQSAYSELGIGIGNIGFGNHKIFRLDYFQSYSNSQYFKGFRVGLVF